MTIREALADATRRLAEAGVEAPRQHAEILLGELLGTNRGGLLARAPHDLGAADEARFAALVARRAAREPLQHLVGHWPFLELELKVDRRALIPRPETEDLALRARARLPADRATRAADVGTGTGCLALALAASHPLATVVAVDASPAALDLARENRDALGAARPGLAARVELRQGDLLVGVDGPFDLVVANLPYVAEAEIAGLEPEVREHDPLVALVAADDGLELIRRLCDDAPRVLAPGGWLLLEMAPRQTAGVAEALSRAAGWRDVAVLRDHALRERLVEARREA